MTVIVEYGHLLIGVVACGTHARVTRARDTTNGNVSDRPYGLPYIENANNFILDYHLVYAGILFYLIVKQAGCVWGLDGWAETYFGSNNIHIYAR